MEKKNKKIVDSVEDSAEDIFYKGRYHDTRQEDFDMYLEDRSRLVQIVQQRLEYMQSQIDELQLEYCPEEMSQEQLDNWAKNQRPVPEDVVAQLNKWAETQTLNGKQIITFGRMPLSGNKDNVEEFVDTNHNELWIDGIRFELDK